MKLLPKRDIQKKTELKAKLKAKNEHELTKDEQELIIARTHVAKERKEITKELAEFRVVKDKEIALLKAISEQLEKQNQQLTKDLDEKRQQIEESKNIYTEKLKELEVKESEITLTQHLLNNTSSNLTKEMQLLTERKHGLDIFQTALESKEKTFRLYLESQEARIAEANERLKTREEELVKQRESIDAITELNRRDRTQLETKEAELANREKLLASRQEQLKQAQRKLNS